MPFSFDKLTDRRNTDSMKWDFAAFFGHPEDALPLWVADMDFPSPPAVQEAVRKVADHGVFGYADFHEDYFDAVAHWFTTHHGFTPKREWTTVTPGVVFALCAAINAFTEPGGAVLIQPPVYHPFYSAIEQNGRTLVKNPLALINGRYEMDFLDLEEKLSRPEVTLMILCSPHNPVGRIWPAEDLRRVGELCLKHGVLLISDEIHCDFAYPGHKHTMLPLVEERFADNCVLLTAPSKTFNIAGLQISNAFISNPTLNARFRAAVARTGAGHPNNFGLAAAKAAMLHGAGWLDELLLYLEDNARFVRGFLEEKTPAIKLVDPDGTYLLWLDFRGLGLTAEELKAFLLQRARLWLDEGTKFGQEGAGFMRMNIGCPRATLEEAMGRLERALR